ncbi:MAG: AzlD domain-containing protein [Erysipelotrichaceae bacterium]|nr:AzlD domain-containing protein [Erysipelotrichaceae bacterium]MDY5251956.1 AzlD domain-containing protein [Erysipelotrichaceae bacterium]
MKQYLAYTIIMALVTYLIRMLPITIFQKEITNKYLKSFLYYVPYAVLGAMTFPTIFMATNNITSSLFGTLVALWLAYQEKSLITVAIFACIMAYICELFIH